VTAERLDAAGRSDVGSPAPGWLESEPALGGATRAALAMLARRARHSWMIWVPAAVLVAGLLTLRTARQPETYAVKVFVRAVEGAASGSRVVDVTLGQMRADVDARVFTSDRITEVMRRHVAAFPDVADDPSGAVAAFREAMDVDFVENDFVEDREPNAPARSTLIAVTFHAAKPELAWNIAHELTDMLIESSQEGQARAQKRRAEAADVAVKQATADFDEAARVAAGAPDVRVRIARERLLAAQAAQAAANFSATAASEHQVLRFDVIDAGVMPTPIDRRDELTTMFITVLAACLAAIWLLAGAFDPRVLDAVDLAALGAPVLGQVPALPSFRNSGAGKSAVSATGRDEPRP
jgi:hypothetical protein